MTPYETPRDRVRLATRARLAYEIGGLRLGLRTAWPVLPLYLLSCGCCGPQVVTLVLTLALLIGAVTLVSASRELGQAVRAGLLAGVLCATVPMAMKFMPLCSVVGCRSLTQFCLYGGLLAGAFLGHLIRLLDAHRPSFFLTAVGIAALTGAIGCTIAGIAGVAGMALGVVCASMPFLLVSRVR